MSANVEHLRRVVEVRIANLRTLCDELEQIIAATEDCKRAFTWLDTVRNAEDRLAHAVRMAALAADLAEDR